jgi:predicted nicotinamide N-methyase
MDSSASPHLYQSGVLTHPATGRTTALKVINMSWTDTDSYPPEQAHLLLGSDLVYDIGILAVLIPAICSTLSAGTLY